MHEIPVRKMEFGFPERIDPLVIPGKPEQSYGIIGLSLLLFSPGIEWSAGLSGLICALFTFAAVRAARSGDYMSGAIVLLLVAKVVLEKHFGANASWEALLGSPIAVDTHLFGVIAGFVLAIVPMGFRVATESRADRRITVDIEGGDRR